MPRKTIVRSVLIALSLASAAAGAAELNTLRGVARETVLANPEVLAAYHEFQAAEQETLVARGNYFPRLDMEAGVGKERIEDPRFPSNDFSRDRVSVTLNQMLFDGFATRNEVRRLGHAARTRYYEVLSASEQLSAEAARAYYDVLRHRELKAMSEDNYATHRMIYDQIERRVRAGVSRRVDLEQAAGRLALSESNLLTDITNLHDVSARYQRLTGKLPEAELEEPEIAPNLLPGTVRDTLVAAYANNPLMIASVANVWSSESAAEVAKAAFVPRFDIRARQDVWHDKDDINGRYEEGVIELVMTYNLFNGGSDRAARKRLLYKTNQALDLRDKTCRDIRQEVSIAYNNTKRLEEQKIYLERHQLSIEKAREAYRRQFDIGQRTLLDMLDTENEYYEARRAYLNAERDHDISYARTLAGTGSLIAALTLGSDLHPMQLPKSHGEQMPDMYPVCPTEETNAAPLDKDAIFREAMERGGYMQDRAPSPAQPAAPIPYTKGVPPAAAAPGWGSSSTPAPEAPESLPD